MRMPNVRIQISKEIQMTNLIASQKVVTPVKTGVQCFESSKILDVLARFDHSASLRSPGWSLSR